MLTWQQSTKQLVLPPKGFSDYQKEYVLKKGAMDLFLDLWKSILKWQKKFNNKRNWFKVTPKQVLNRLKIGTLPLLFCRIHFSSSWSGWRKATSSQALNLNICMFVFIALALVSKETFLFACVRWGWDVFTLLVLCLKQVSAAGCVSRFYLQHHHHHLEKKLWTNFPPTRR